MPVLIRGNLSVSTRSCRDLHTLVWWSTRHGRVEVKMLKIFETAKLTDKLLFSQAVFVRIRSIKRNNSKNAKNLSRNY